MSSIANRKNFPAEVRRTLDLAFPVIIGQVAVFSMNFVDTVMSGRLPEKDIALAGLGVGGAFFSAIMMFTLGVLMAVQPIVAQLDGADRQSEGGEELRQAVWIALFLAVPFWLLTRYSEPLLVLFRIDPAIVPTAASYLRALSFGAPAISLVFLLRFFSEGAGMTRATMLYGILGSLLNIPLNWILMFGKLGMPALGTVGCGYASSIVYWMQFLILFLFITRHRHFKPFDVVRRLDRPDWQRIRELLRIGLPIAVSIFMEGSMFVGAALLIGQLGPVPAAAHLIAINFSAMWFMIPVGLGSAIAIRVGNAIGRQDPEAARYAGLIGLVTVLGFQTVSATVIFLIPEAIVRLYTSDVSVAPIAVGLLFYSAIFQYSDGIQMCAAGALRGMKDTRVPMVITIFSFWLLGLPVGYHLTFGRELGPSGMWIGMIVGLTVAAVLMTWRFASVSGQHVRK